MTGQVIAFPNSAAQPVQQGQTDLRHTAAPLYSMEWVTETGEKVFKNTTDDAAIRRQLSSCQRRGLMAVVRTSEGSACGGVHFETTLVDRELVRRFVAHFLDVSWGD